LAHELQHMRRWDVEWELVLVFLKPFFFWNPVFGRWKRELEHLRELSCDQALIRKQRVQPRAYADCLLKVCRRSVSGEGAFNIVTPRVPLVSLSRTYLGRRNIRVLKDRIREISARQPMRRHSRIALWPVLVVSCVVVALGASSIQRPSDWSQDRLMLSTIVNLERLEQRNSGISLAGF
jgi:beta-lactamase regulating signal transducer with metallopeptidase domain